MEIEGRIIQIDTPETINTKNGEFTKQSIIIETEDSYPKKICLESWNDRIKIDNYKIGDKVSAKIDIQSREYNGRWYTSVKVWELNSLSANNEAAGFADDAPVPQDFKEELSDEDPPF